MSLNKIISFLNLFYFFKKIRGLDANQFTGSIPFSIENLTQLEYL